MDREKGGAVSKGKGKGISYMDSILIDYSLLISQESANEQEEEVDKFESALRSWGCFQLINHGIPTSVLDDLRLASRQFFALPTEDKLKYSMPEGGNNGYDGKTTQSHQDMDMDMDILDWNEGLNLTLFPQDRRKLHFWPQHPDNFKTLVDEYSKKVEPIFEELFKMVLKSLKVDMEKFESQYGRNKEMNMRLNFYPVSPSSRHGLGLQPHADFSAITLLLQDEEGLQVLKDDQWFLVPVLSHALFLTLGDPTEIITNGIFKSAVHKVVTSAEKSRLSVALFWDSDRNRLIGPLDDLITSSCPQRYQTVSLQDYITKFADYYPQGKRLIDAIRILNT